MIEPSELVPGTLSTTVQIGMPKKSPPNMLKSCYFPSKIGGKPAWLDLENLPSVEELQCKLCKKPMTFLCQVYAPCDDDQNFHRTIFVFVCRNLNCFKYNCSDNFRVFRNSLSKVNQFYSVDTPTENEHEKFDGSSWTKVCNLCGCRANKACLSCETVYYCCDEHQATDFKDHQKSCGSNELNDQSNWVALFPQYEIKIEKEIINFEDVSQGTIAELEKYEKFIKSDKYAFGRSLERFNEKRQERDLNIPNQNENIDDYLKFQTRIKNQPAQVLRYDRGRFPLPIDAKPPRLIGSVPAYCHYCNGPSQFEFQIMPQLIYLVKDTVLDFGTLNIYTCKNSCVLREGYKREIIVKEDFLSSFKVQDWTMLSNNEELISLPLKSFLTYLATITCLRINLGMSKEEVHKLELGTILTKENSTRFHILREMPNRGTTFPEEELDEILKELAVYQRRYNMQDGIYLLKEVVWEKYYNPIFIALHYVHLPNSLDRFLQYHASKHGYKLLDKSNYWLPHKYPVDCNLNYTDPRILLPTYLPY